MIRGTQFTVTSIMWLTTIVALVVAWKTSTEIAVIALIEIIGVLCCTEALTWKLPAAIQQAIKANCSRKDGSWSAKRARSEHLAVQKMRWNLTAILVIVLLPTNAMLLFVNSEVIPLSIGIDAFSSFQLTGDAWKEHLRDEEKRLYHWGETNHKSTTEIEFRKRMLWNCWPLILMAGFAWSVACFVLVKAIYLQSLKELFVSVQMRRRQYVMHDFRTGQKKGRREHSQLARH